MSRLALILLVMGAAVAFIPTAMHARDRRLAGIARVQADRWKAHREQLLERLSELPNGVDSVEVRATLGAVASSANNSPSVAPLSESRPRDEYPIHFIMSEPGQQGFFASDEVQAGASLIRTLGGRGFGARGGELVGASQFVRRTSTHLMIFGSPVWNVASKHYLKSSQVQRLGVGFFSDPRVPLDFAGVEVPGQREIAPIGLALMEDADAMDAGVLRRLSLELASPLDHDVGLIVHTANPWDSRTRALLLAGVTSLGTLAAGIALESHAKTVADAAGTGSFAALVMGHRLFTDDGAKEHIKTEILRIVVLKD
jgi:hypothetical protein